MPVPMVAPTPNIVSWKVPKLRSSSGPSCGPFCSRIGLRRFSWLPRGMRSAVSVMVSPVSGACVSGPEFRPCQERGITRVGWYPPFHLTGCPP